jgi:hypothetical protein
MDEAPAEAIETAASEPEAAEALEGSNEEVFVDLDALMDASADDAAPEEEAAESAPAAESEPEAKANDAAPEEHEEVVVDLDALDEEPQAEVMIDLDALDADASEAAPVEEPKPAPTPAEEPKPQPKSVAAPVKDEQPEDRNEESIGLFDGDGADADFDISKLVSEAPTEPEVTAQEPEDVPSEEAASVASEDQDKPEQNDNADFSEDDYAAIGAALF